MIKAFSNLNPTSSQPRRSKMRSATICDGGILLMRSHSLGPSLDRRKQGREAVEPPRSAPIIAAMGLH